jgi:hypothetical protein
MTDNNVIQMPEPLETIGQRIDAAYERAQHGREEWIEGTLDLAQAFADARARFPSNNEFGAWCGRNGHDHVSHQDRAALISMAENLPLARIVLEETERRSWQLIWAQEMKGRRSSASKKEPSAASSPQPHAEIAPALETDDPSKNQPAAAGAKVTKRSKMYGAPRADELASLFQNKKTRHMIARIWQSRGGKQIWELIISALDAGLITPNKRDIEKPNLALLFPSVPPIVARGYDLSNQMERTRVRELLLPTMIACRDKLFAEPDRFREIISEHEKDQRGQQQAITVAKKRAVAVAAMPPLEQELVMFGQTVWPRLDINQGEYTYDQVRAAIWTFRDFEAWNQMAKEDTESHARRIRNSLRYLGEYLLRTDRENPMARIYNLMSWFSHLMEKNPKAECKWPMYPHIEGQW